MGRGAKRTPSESGVVWTGREKTMKKPDILAELRKRVLVLDGAMGTEIFRRTGSVPDVPELLNVEAPGVIEAIHHDYVQAGAEIIETNTFGASPLKLAEQGAEDRTEELNRAAVALCRRAAESVDRPVWIAGSMGPCGGLIDPLGPLSRDQVYDSYARQAKALAEAGADLLIIETQIDLLEAKTGLLAVRDVCGLPVVVSMTYPMEGGTTVTGSGADTVAVTLDALPVDVVGINCGGHPEGFYDLIETLALLTDKPLAAYANAGLPERHDGRLVYPVGPEEFVGFAERFAQLGVALIGGCCGTGPDHIAQISRRLGGRAVTERFADEKGVFRLASRSRVFEIGPRRPFGLVGESINPFGRKTLARAIANDDLEPVRRLVRKQERAGAHCLDVNLGRRADKEPEFFGRVVAQIQSVSTLPLFLDSSKLQTLRRGLESVAGKAAINSVAQGPESEELFGLARRYGAGVVLLAMNQEGIPDDPAGRVQIITELYEQALAAGLRPRDIVADPVVLAAASAGSIAATAGAAGLLAQKGVATVCGLSNVSYGLPGRSALNAAFLAMLMAEGLDSAICDVTDPRLAEMAVVASALVGRDRGMKRFVARFGESLSDRIVEPSSPENGVTGAEGRQGGLDGDEDDHGKDESDAALLERAVFDGERELAAGAATRLLDEGMDGIAIVETILGPALRRVGDLYEKKVIFLPQLILSAEAARAAAEVIESRMDESGKVSEPKGTVIIATVRGDIHDIGKNIVALVLRNHGYQVVDLGKSVDARSIVAEAGKRGAQVIALSALMTTTMDAMAEVVAERNAAAPDVKVIIGGAAVTDRFRREIGADGYGKDAVAAARLIEAILSDNEASNETDDSEERPS